MSSLVKAPLPYEAEAPIECDPRWPLLAADGSVSKRFWLSLSRPSGHRAGNAAGFPDGRQPEVLSGESRRDATSRFAESDHALPWM